jgi:hypothetical protein
MTDNEEYLLLSISWLTTNICLGMLLEVIDEGGGVIVL